jgi:hypothetical protein
MTSDYQWHRIRFPKGELASGAMGCLVMDSLLPATEEQEVDLGTVAIFEVDDSEAASTCISRRALLRRSSISLTCEGLTLPQ